MKRIFIFLSLLSGLSSCATLQPRITDSEDPFSGVRIRTMTVGESSNYQLLTALSEASASSNPYLYRPVKTSPLPVGQALLLTETAGQTTLTFIRFAPERAFDIPEDSKLLVRFYDTKNRQTGVATLPILKKYHTIGGPLIAVAMVDQKAQQMLQRETADIIRIDRVSTNESDLLPVDWYLPAMYAQAFRKGMNLFYEKKETRQVPRK